MDLVADQLADGRKFRALTVMDVFTRESLAIEVGQRLKGDDVVSTLNGIRSPRLSQTVPIETLVTAIMSTVSASSTPG